MAHWNHRVVQKKCDGEVYYEIHEAHYNDDGQLYAITENPVTPYADSYDQQHGLRWVLNQMLSACDKEILIEGEIEFAPFTVFGE